MSVTPINSFAEFQQIINRDEVSVIDFWATWCGPCRVISPVFETLSKDFTNIKYYKLDVDEQADAAQEAGVRAMPTFIAFRKGEKLGELVGADPTRLKNLLIANN